MTLSHSKRNLHMLFLSFLILALSASLASAAVDTSRGWHPVSQISTTPSSTTSIDNNANGVIDNSESCSGDAICEVNQQIDISGGYAVVQAVNNDLEIKTVGGHNVLLNPTGGNVGIGTANPEQALEVNGNVWTRGSQLIIDRPDTTGGWARGIMYYPTGSSTGTELAGIGVLGSGTSVTRIYLTHGDDPWASSTGINILSNGNVGIGTTSPNRKLVVYGIDATLGLVSTDGYQWDFVNSPAWSPGSFHIWSRNPDSARLSILSNGNVGIGTTEPKGKLGVSFNDDDEIVMYSPGNNQLAIQTTLDGQPISGYGGDSENRLILQPVIGNVGIGTTSPGAKLQVVGLSWFAANAGFTAGNAVEIGNDVYLADLDTANTMGVYGAQDSAVGSIKLGSGGGTISGYNGNVGIGTTSPGYTLDLVATNGAMRLRNAVTDATTKAGRIVVGHYNNAEEDFYFFGGASTNTDNYVAIGGGYFGFNAATQIDLFTAADTTTLTGTSRITIRNNGNVGIGTTTPSQKLDVAGQIHATGDICTDVGGGSCLSTVTGGSEGWTVSGSDMYSDISGNVGIGTNSPSDKLVVAGRIIATDICTAGGKCLSLTDPPCTDSDGGINYFVQGTTTKLGAQVDFCWGGYYGDMSEYYCDSNGQIAGVAYRCGNNPQYNCVSGACQVTCSDVICPVQCAAECACGSYGSTCNYGHCVCACIECIPTTCFVAGTKVRMADGSLKNIEDVQIGEKVKGKNGIINNVIGFERPIIGARNTYILNGKLEFTGDHPLLTTAGWKVADVDLFYKTRKDPELRPTQLKVGDILIKEKGEETVKTLEKMSNRPAEEIVYDLKLDGDSTYTANGFIAHNCECFVAGTKVRMADGSLKNIEDVQIGEKLRGMNGSINKVTGFERPIIGALNTYILNGQSEFTGGHPLLTTEGWKVADPDLYYKTRKNLELKPTQLEVGDIVITEKGQETVKTLEKMSNRPAEEIVYDFKLEGDGTYIANGHIVHN